MAAGDVRNGQFNRTHADGAVTIATLIGGGNYTILMIRSGGRLVIGGAGIDQGSGYTIAPGEPFFIDNGGNTAATLIDGAKINVRVADGAKSVSFEVFAIDNA